MFRGIRSFKKELGDFVDRVPKKAHRTARKIAREFFTEIVTKTPKDTNFASSLWKYKVNSKPTNIPISNPRGGRYSPASTPSFSDFRMGDRLYIYNNASYLPRLNDGWSQQAPKNFFTNAVARAQYKLQKEFNKIK